MASDDFERECSATCVRAGLSALLFAGFGFTLLPILDRATLADAFGGYVSHRLRLANALESLERDACWQQLTEALNVKDSDSVTVDQMVAFQCVAGPVATNTEPAAHRESSSSRRPSQPRAIRMVSGFLPGAEIKEALESLNDDPLLERARRFSNLSEQSIYRWQVLRAQLTPHAVNMVVVMAPPQGTAPGRMRKSDIDDMTLRDVRRLSSFEPTSVQAFDEATKEFRQIPIPSLAYRLGLDGVVQAVDIVVLLSLFWFWLFEREARTSSSSPQPGTMFRAFGRSVSSRLSFYVLLCVPAFSVGWLADKTWNDHPVVGVASTAVTIWLISVIAIDMFRFAFGRFDGIHH
jgi:hypothetical protein